MNLSRLSLFLVLLLLSNAAQSARPNPNEKKADGRPQLSLTYGKLQLAFEANRGQTDRQVKFLSRGRGYTLFLTANEAVLELAKPSAEKRSANPITAFRQSRTCLEGQQTTVVRMKLIGANPSTAIVGVGKLPSKSNYFIGKDPNKWRTDIPNYAKVAYENVYPGIDLVYYGNHQQLEYDFVVDPGADASKIALRIEGADELTGDAAGDLILDSKNAHIRLHKPRIYQEVNGQRNEVAGGYVLRGENQVGFEVANYDFTKPLIIDPVLSYSTYLGGTSADSGLAIAVDTSGAAYVAGSTFSTDFPQVNPVQGDNAGGADTFVAKLDASGSALLYSTYLGGSGDEFGAAIALDIRGNAYVAGNTTSSDFPTTPGAFQTVFGGSGVRSLGDAFVVKLDASGSALVYSTYLGGNDDDSGTAIAVDSVGNAYVTGLTYTSSLHTTTGAFKRHCVEFHGNCSGDVFVTELNAAGSVLKYSTYLGGNQEDRGQAIALDASGNIYVTGVTGSNDFPTTQGTFQPTLRGIRPTAFVTKIDPSQSGAASLVYSSYLGQPGGNGGAFFVIEPRSIAVDTSGEAYVAGVTNFPEFPNGGFQNKCRGCLAGDPLRTDGFITKFNSTGSALVYSTFLGGGLGDGINGLALDSSGNAYVAGFTNSTNFPTVNPVQSANAGGADDAFVVELNATGSSLLFSTYLGGSDFDSAAAIGLDAAGSIYVAGSTVSTDFPTTPGVLQPGSSGGSDAFVAKIVP